MTYFVPHLALEKVERDKRFPSQFRELQIYLEAPWRLRGRRKKDRPPSQTHTASSHYSAQVSKHPLQGHTVEEIVS